MSIDSKSSSDREHREKLSDLNQITEHIFVGNQAAASTESVLLQYNIRRIVRLRSQPYLAVPRCVNTVTFCQIEDLSIYDITACFEQCFTAIIEAIQSDQRILVHCHAGKSRSPAVVIAFLMTYQRLSLHDAYRHVEKCRNGLAMNLTFKRQLCDYEYSLFGQRTMRFCIFCSELDCSCSSYMLLKQRQAEVNQQGNIVEVQPQRRAEGHPPLDLQTLSNQLKETELLKRDLFSTVYADEQRKNTRPFDSDASVNTMSVYDDEDWWMYVSGDSQQEETSLFPETPSEDERKSKSPSPDHYEEYDQMLREEMLASAILGSHVPTSNDGTVFTSPQLDDTPANSTHIILPEFDDRRKSNLRKQTLKQQQWPGSTLLIKPSYSSLILQEQAPLIVILMDCDCGYPSAFIYSVRLSSTSTSTIK
ncbi:putative Dual specificity phosphatase, catalytic domain containing protein [Blattamonas nauphoetae]|uniref:protein-tyrosine-phosphatase n=1 Tax=Blattamonas nauphoetae TaxID=2049346 RepID=A0ABQ9Y672_9EUKA|nr:putative Dual specificity phosphatase, catalytic domain containing protein [Blattamonas nauphoetae]